MQENLLGIISDTHGLVRPQIAEAFAGVCRILHAGDIGDPEVLEQLRTIAPVVAVCGNVDRGELRRGLARTEVVEVGECLLYMLHNVDELDLEPRAAGMSAVVFGHTHVPAIEVRGTVLYLNPGSAGPQTARSAVSVALLRIEGTRLDAKIVELAP